jgi:hypothetical protein
MFAPGLTIRMEPWVEFNKTFLWTYFTNVHIKVGVSLAVLPKNTSIFVDKVRSLS